MKINGHEIKPLVNLRGADLSGDNLRGADLSEANLSGANLSGANLSGANLSGANLFKADLLKADLSGANLGGADLSEANLSGANLGEANLGGANLSGANLFKADLSGANLSGANLFKADLSGASLIKADLSGANLRGANLSGADLSGADGLPSASLWLRQFESDRHGIIVYRAKNGYYDHPKQWDYKAGSVLIEQVNPDRSTECGSGVSFGTLEYVKKEHPNAEIWKARIPWRWLADVVVPFNTNGKARCQLLELIDVVT